MRNTRRLSVQSLFLTAALAFALSVPAAAREQKPPAKPPQIEKPAPEKPAQAEKPGEQPGEEARPEAETPPAEESGEEQPPEAAPPEPEAAPEEKPAEETKPAETVKPAEKAKPAEETKPAEEAVSPTEEAVNAAVEMSKRLASLKTFSVKANLAWEEVLENGEKILALEQLKADVSRPHGLRMERMSPGRQRVLFYNGEVAVLWGPVTRYYAAAPFTGTLAELTTHLAEKYGYEIPLADLFMWGHDEAQIKSVKSANFIGQDRIGGRVCDHYAFRQEGADWQLWIDTGKGGLPCGYAIIDLSDPARPLFLATVKISPNAGFDDDRFTFEPPKDAVEIPLATTKSLKEGAAPEEGKAPKEEQTPKEEQAPEGEQSPKEEQAPREEKAPKEEEGPSQKGEPGKPDTGKPDGTSPR